MSKKACLNLMLYLLPLCSSYASTFVDEGLEARVGKAARSVVVYVDNFSGCTLTRVSYHEDGGIWKMTPCDNIPHNHTGRWATESKGFMTGTEAEAHYKCPHGTHTFHWNNPFSGSNSYSKSGPHPVTESGGGGDNATIRFILKN